jgi:hypothetical protein
MTWTKYPAAAGKPKQITMPPSPQVYDKKHNKYFGGN